MVDAELTISIDSKKLVMSKSIYNTRAGTLPKSTQDEPAHLATGQVACVDIDVESVKHGGEVVSKDEQRRH